VLQHLPRADDVEWSIDPDSKITLGMHICSPRTVYFVIVRWVG